MSKTIKKINKALLFRISLITAGIITTIFSLSAKGRTSDQFVNTIIDPLIESSYAGPDGPCPAPSDCPTADGSGGPAPSDGDITPYAPPPPPPPSVQVNFN